MNSERSDDDGMREILSIITYQVASHLPLSQTGVYYCGDLEGHNYYIMCLSHWR